MHNSSTDRIVAELRTWITSAPEGRQLPSTRTLTERFRASPVTVQKAIRQLAAQGLIDTRPGVGTFVRAERASRPVDFGWQTSALGAAPSRAPLPSPQRALSDDAIALHSGYPDRDLLPERSVRAALTRAARSGTAVSRSPAAGMQELRTWFATEVANDTPTHTAPPAARDVLILPGSQSGLSAIFRAIVGHGNPVLIESPSYWGAILAAESAGLTLIPVASGPTGPDPAAIEEAFERTGARAFYAQPNFTNPTGVQWSRERAHAVLEVVRRHRAFLIEDDWAHDLAIEAESAPLAGMDDSGHVLYLRSLTKSVSPALRVAALIARGPARDRLLADRSAESLYVSGVLQAAALDVVTQPGWPAHLQRLRRRLRQRRDLLLESIREHAPELHVETVPRGGVSLWARLTEGTDADRLAVECESRGVIVGPGSEWFPAEPSGSYLRLNYCGTDPERFPEAMSVISDCL